VALDDLPAAAKSVSAVRDVLAATGDPYWLALARARLAEITVARGDLAAAEDHCRATITAMTHLRGWGTVALGLELLAAVLAEDRGLRFRRAVRLLGAAQTYRERYRQPGSMTRRAQVQGLAYRLRHEVGDVAYAENLRAGAGLSPAGALLELGAGSRPGRPTARLTQRQREVAELVASGLTNREIARRLGVAEWTVVNHVRQVLRKLEVSSRVHVARWFAEQQSA
jgi:DNA-binding CsgD family transcriptional regulator